MELGVGSFTQKQQIFHFKKYLGQKFFFVQGNKSQKIKVGRLEKKVTRINLELFIFQDTLIIDCTLAMLF